MYGEIWLVLQFTQNDRVDDHKTTQTKRCMENGYEETNWDASQRYAKSPQWNKIWPQSDQKTWRHRWCKMTTKQCKMIVMEQRLVIKRSKTARWLQRHKLPPTWPQSDTKCLHYHAIARTQSDRKETQKAVKSCTQTTTVLSFSHIRGPYLMSGTLK